MISSNQVKSKLKKRVGKITARAPISRLLLGIKPKLSSSRIDGMLAAEHLSNGDLLQAEKYLLRALVNRPRSDSYRYRLGLIYLKLQRYEEALKEFNAALSISMNPKYLYHRGRTFESLQHIHDAIGDYFLALELPKAEDRAVPALRNLIISAPMTVAERTQYMTRAAEAGVEGHRWLVDLGRLHSEQKLNTGAAYWYSRAESMSKLESGDLYRYGLSLHLAGRKDTAREKFAQLLGSKELKKYKFGLASLHASKGNWILARDEYSKASVTEAENVAEYYYESAMAYDRCYEFDSAARYYALAVAEDSGHPYWWWRAGFAFEKSGNFEIAAEYFWHSSKLRPSLNGAYHAGRMKSKLQDYGAAVDLFASTPEMAEILSSRGWGVPCIGWHERLLGANTAHCALQMRTIGIASLREGKFQQAAHALSRAVEGLEYFDPVAYAALGYALNALGQTREAVEAYLQIQAQQSPDGVGRSVKLSPWEVKLSNYLAYRSELAIHESAILYEVGHGSSVSCNPLALYRQALLSPKLQNYTHIWVINPGTPVPDEVASNPRVVLVNRETEIYFKWLAVAKYLINNTSFGSYFIRRDGQKYLNTWHGTPHKTLGKSVKDSELSYGNISRNILQMTHLSVGNEWTAQKLIQEHGVAALTKSETAICGSPRLDILKGNLNDADLELKRNLGIETDTPVAIYVPTWRGAIHSKDGVINSGEEDHAAINAIERAGFQVLYSAHRFVHESQSGLAERFKLIPQDVDLYSVLRIADVLVTDYSSVWIDFLVLDRPIVFYQYDREHYSTQRGLYDVKEPGSVVHDPAGLTECMRGVKNGEDEFRHERANARATFGPMEDGLASRRVIDWFLLDESSSVSILASEVKPAALFRQSFIPNGIAASFRALSSELVLQGAIEPFVLVDPRSIKDDAERRQQLGALKAEVNVIPRVGRMLFTPEERWLEKKHTTGAGQITECQFNVLLNAYRRELERLFGTAAFETVCEFDGYSRFWTMLFSAADSSFRKVIYLHNNMEEEFSAKHPELNYVFELYRKFDRLVSVSESVNEANRINISQRFAVPTEKFTWANNLINSADIMSLADAPLDTTVQKFISNAGCLAVAVGRLSIEKGHDRLVRALAKVREDIRLVVVGGGPERENLESLVRQLNLSDRVLITGHLANPYPIMKRADGVTLLSLWEGQGITILEAMLLGIPVVATDIPGPKSIMDEFGGTLVPNTDEGVRQALEVLASGGLTQPEFDVERYNASAFDRTLSALLPVMESVQG